MSDANTSIAPFRQRVAFPPNRVMRRRPTAQPGQYSATPLDGMEPDPNSASHLPSPPESSRVYRAFGKRALDIALIVLAAPLALFLIGAAAAALWIEGGSPFYRQARLGKGGETFSILKLRTMVHDADRLLEANLAADPALREEWNTTQKLRQDPRITPLGALLRRTSMDELPQLWNVLKGEMSLVGPRPMLPEQLPLYGDAAHYFALRPGITGYWQVSQRNQSAFTARAAQDAAYDMDMSVIEDAKVLWRTVGAVVNQTGC